jgi:hypothetical protein
VPKLVWAGALLVGTRAKQEGIIVGGDEGHQTINIPISVTLGEFVYDRQHGRFGLWICFHHTLLC